MDKLLKKNYRLIIAIILALFFAVSALGAKNDSITYDERAHIPASYSYMKFGDMRLNPEHPPLIKDLTGVPLLFMDDLNFPLDSKEWKKGVFQQYGTKKVHNEQWEIGTEFLESNDADQIAFWSRIPVIVVAVILGIFIFVWTRELAGIGAGLLALILYSFDPNILGHNHYVTTDIGIAAFIFISFYFFIKFIKKPDWKNTVLAGIFLALVQLTKFSAVLLLPIFGLTIFIYALARKRPDFSRVSVFHFKWNIFWEYVRKFVLIMIICFGIIWIVYALNTINMPENKIETVATDYLGTGDLAEKTKTVISGIGSVPMMEPLADYFWGAAMVFSRVAGGNTFYYFGEVSAEAKQGYFPMVFLMKETIPFLILLLFTSLFTVFQILKNFRLKKITNYLRTGVAQYSMLGFIALYLYLSITGNLNIGFRHLFPIMPFLYVLVAKKTFDFIHNRHGSGKTVSRIIIALFSVWIVLIPVVNYPSYLSYFNEFAGGPKNGYKYVTDSNVDWGQDMLRLKKWVTDYNKSCHSDKAIIGNCHDISNGNPIDKIRIDYFGAMNPQYYFGERHIPWWGDRRPIESGWYAISATFLQESIYRTDRPGEENYSWTLEHEPVKRIGDSIFVYYIK